MDWRIADLADTLAVKLEAESTIATFAAVGLDKERDLRRQLERSMLATLAILKDHSDTLDDVVREFGDLVPVDEDKYVVDKQRDDEGAPQ